MRRWAYIGLALLLLSFLLTPVQASGQLSINSSANALFLEVGKSQEVNLQVHVANAPTQVDFTVVSSDNGLNARLMNTSAYTTSNDFSNQLTVTPMHGIRPGDYVVTVKAFANGEFAEKDILITIPRPEESGETFIVFNSEPSTCQVVFRGESSVFNLTVVNQGVYGDFAIEALNVPQGVSFEFHPSNVFMDMGANVIETANIEFKIPEEFETGSKNVLLNLKNLRNDQVIAQTPVCFNVVKSTGAVLTANVKEVSVKPGESKDVTFSLQNTGSDEAEFFITTNKEHATPSKSSIELESGESKEFTVSIAISEDFGFAGSESLRVTAKSFDVERVESITVNVLQERVSVTTSKDLTTQESDSVSTVLKFRNNSNQDYETVKVRLNGVPDAWSYEVEPARFSLRKGEEKSVSVKLNTNGESADPSMEAVLIYEDPSGGEVQIASKPLALSELTGDDSPTALIGLTLFNPLNGLLVIMLLALAYFSYAHYNKHFKEEDSSQSLEEQKRKWSFHSKQKTRLDEKNTGVSLLKSHLNE